MARPVHDTSVPLPPTVHDTLTLPQPQPGLALTLAPERWSRPLDWLAVLSAFITTVPASADVTLYLDARAADVSPLTLRSIVERACAYLSEDADFAPVVLLEGTAEPPPGAEPIAGAAELVERLGLDAEPLPEEPLAIVQHARWCKALVDALQSELDTAEFDARPRPPADRYPLVTVRIPTFGSTELLVGRAIPSVLSGYYQSVEVLVCSDGPQPHARAAVEAIEDSRVRYLELERRPRYASAPDAFWQTAGVFATNRLLDEAQGAFIAPLDHDDAFTFQHVHVLLEALAKGPGDFAYGQAMTEYPNGAWELLGNAPLAEGAVVHATVMYSRRLGHMRYDPHAWLLDEPADWNLWRRMIATGAAIGHVPVPVAVHFKERSSIDHQAPSERTPIDVTATDVLETSACELLAVSSRRHAARGLPVHTRGRAR